MFRRLAVAFVIFAIIAVACYLVSPKIHLTIPWYLPMIAFLITMVSVVWSAPRTPEDESPAREWRAPKPDTSDNPLPEDLDDPPDSYRFRR